MLTPFDKVISDIIARGYHNHRLEEHSDTVSEGIYQDLLKCCDDFRHDIEDETVRYWPNEKTPGARGRKVDLLVGEPGTDGKPDLSKVRICVENKSVTTAHRNRYARFDDLNETLQVLHTEKSETIMAATVLVGTADRYLNIPDRVKPFYKHDPEGFKNLVSRLSKGDETLWDEYRFAISENRPPEVLRTIEKFRQLPTRNTGYTHKIGYDYLLIVPVYIDNVNPPFIVRSEEFGIDVNSQYQQMLRRICQAYVTRWHMD